MSFDTFCEDARVAMESYLGENSIVQIEKIKKNNGLVLTALVARRQMHGIAPTIYMEDFYEAYECGCSFGTIMERMIEFYEQHADVEMDVAFFGDYETMKKKVVVRLINYEKNRKLLEEVPHILWEDLAIVFYCIFMNDEIGYGTILIRNEHMQIWDVSVEELHEAAMENTPRLLNDELSSMVEMLQDLAQESLIEYEDAGGIPMYVLTNKWKQYGAVVMLYSIKMRMLAEKLNRNLIILPSSIHEVIIMPENEDMDFRYMKDVVRGINETQVAQEEILSDSIYYYDRYTNKVAVVG